MAPRIPSQDSKINDFIDIELANMSEDQKKKEEDEKALNDYLDYVDKFYEERQNNNAQKPDNQEEEKKEPTKMKKSRRRRRHLSSYGNYPEKEDPDIALEMVRRKFPELYYRCKED